MKKLVLFLVSIVCGMLAICQNDDAMQLPYEQRFESLDLPGWEFRVDDHIVNPSTYAPISVCGGYLVSQCLEYSTDRSEYSDNWIISPRFYISHMSCYVRWRSRSRNFLDSYEVAISLSGTDTNDFVAIRTIEDSQTYIWSDNIVDLSDFVGQYVRVAFRHKAHYGSTIYLDDFYMSDGTPTILSFSGPNRVYPMEYTRFSIEVVSMCWYDIFVNAPGLEEYWVVDSSTLMMVFSPIGDVDTIDVEVVVENQYGRDTSNIVVLLMSGCYQNIIEDYPYTAPTDGSGCWRSVSLNNSSNVSWTFGSQYFRASGNRYDVCLVGPSMMITDEIMQLHLQGRHYGQIGYAVYFYKGDMLEELDTSLMEPLIPMEYQTPESNQDFNNYVLITNCQEETGRLVIRCREDEGEYTYLMISKIEVSQIQPPIIQSINAPLRIKMGETVTLTANVNSAIPYECYWEVENGEYHADSNTLEVRWEDVPLGDYEIVCTASNSVGFDTDTVHVTVYDCGVISEFPYVVPFSEMRDFECWETWTTTNESGWTLSSSGVIAPFMNVEDSLDTWLVSQCFSFPDTVCLGLNFRYAASHYGREGSALEMYVSTTGRDMSDFELVDVLDFASLSGWSSDYILPLERYVGMNIYIAFRFHTVIPSSYVSLQELMVIPIPSTIYIDTDVDVADVGQDLSFRAIKAGMVTITAWSVDNVIQPILEDTLVVAFDRGGYHTIRVDAEDFNGAPLVDQVLCWVNEVGVINVINTSVEVYPNPTSGLVNMTDEVDWAELYDEKGRMLWREYVPKEIDMRELPIGVYYVRLFYRGTISIIKVVKI